MLSDRNRSPLRATVQAILGVVSCSAAAGALGPGDAGAGIAGRDRGYWLSPEPERRARREARGDRLHRRDRRRGHRRLSRPEHRRIHPARAGRVDRPRRRRRAAGQRARPRSAVHARAHQRHGSDERERRHRRRRRHQSRPLVRLQHVRVRAVQLQSRSASPRRPTSRKDRSARLSICARRARSTTTVSPSSPACRAATTTSTRTWIRAARCSSATRSRTASSAR